MNWHCFKYIFHCTARQKFAVRKQSLSLSKENKHADVCNTDISRNHFPYFPRFIYPSKKHVKYDSVHVYQENSASADLVDRNCRRFQSRYVLKSFPIFLMIDIAMSSMKVVDFYQEDEQLELMLHCFLKQLLSLSSSVGSDAGCQSMRCALEQHAFCYKL